MCRTCTNLAVVDCPPSLGERPADFEEDLAREIDIDARVHLSLERRPTLSGSTVLALRRFFGPPAALDSRSN